MSAQNYKIIIGFDDSQMAKLSKQFGGTFGATGGKSTSAGSNTALFKNLTKLGIIATASIGSLKGIQKLVSLTADSSPILTTMLKLLSTTVTLILRPIGDFLGLFLRPLLIMGLRASLAFYKSMDPVMRALGSKLGQALTPDFSNIGQLVVNSIIGTGGGNILQQALTVLFSEIKLPQIKFPELNIPDLDFSGLDKLGFIFEVMTRKLTNFAFGLPEKIRSSIGFLADSLTNVLSTASFAVTKGYNSLISFFAGINTNLTTLYDGVILPGIEALNVFFTNMVTGITDIISGVTTAISTMFQSIFEFFTNIPSMIMGAIAPQTPEQPATSGQANPIGININFYDSAISGAESIAEFGEEIASTIQNAISGRSS